MKILVTGATGFIGANLVKALIENSSASIFITARPTSDFWRLDDIREQITGICYTNLEDKEQVSKLIERLKPEIVYHAATYGGFPDQTDQLRMIQSNLQATTHLLDASFKHGVNTFINTGSSSEYGLKDAPIGESDVCNPVNFYGVTKLAATNYCTMRGWVDQSRTDQTRVCTLRLFSPYGKMEDPSRLYPSIVNSLSQDERPRLSRPESVRDFIEIDKVIQVYLNIVDANFNSGDIINVGSGKQQSIEEFYGKIARQLGKDHIMPIWGEALPRANEPRMWQADVSKLTSLLPRIL